VLGGEKGKNLIVGIHGPLLTNSAASPRATRASRFRLHEYQPAVFFEIRGPVGAGIFTLALCFPAVPPSGH